jgi:glutathione peroxidase
MPSIYDFSVLDGQGQSVELSAYRGKVLLIVNTASRCGFTPQYASLQALHEAYRARGFSVLGFPCDQFGHQEPAGDAEIQQFCSTRYAVTFPVFHKLEVNGRNAAPLFDYLKAAAPGLFGTRRIKWNFTKFLIDRDGQRVERFAPSTSPNALTPRLDNLLSEIRDDRRLHQASSSSRSR